MITTIIATKNGEKYIGKALDSVFKQSVSSHPNFEVIVISDGSTDNTISFVKNNFPKVIIIENKESVGPGTARNIGISHAKNEYIAILDDDDWWINSDKLKNQIEFLETHKNCLVVGAEKTEFVSENGTHLWWYTHQTDTRVIHDNMLVRCPIINSSVVFRKSAYDSVGGYSDLRLAEDYDLWLRLGKIGDIANIPNTETAYTLRKNSASGSNGKHSTRLARIVLGLVKKYRQDYPNYTKALLKGYLRIIKNFTIGF
ncbi:MAG: glycosyltransferase family 2 protein [Candidatus Taylorbacteria bacterium]|nr:glycosyltransferase family 2 protein [Candidatus Taylorbacteria bacterium]